MDSRIQVITILVAALLLVGVLELVRRRRLLERYALLWLLASTVLLALAVWRGALDKMIQAARPQENEQGRYCSDHQRPENHSSSSLPRITAQDSSLVGS